MPTLFYYKGLLLLSFEGSSSNKEVDRKPLVQSLSVDGVIATNLLTRISEQTQNTKDPMSPADVLLYLIEDSEHAFEIDKPKTK